VLLEILSAQALILKSLVNCVNKTANANVMILIQVDVWLENSAKTTCIIKNMNGIK
jgi:hypothetical protein